MKQKSLSKWLKAAIVLIGISGLVVYLFVIPSEGQALKYSNPEFSNRYLPWLVFILLTGVPVYVALFFAWKVAENIGRNNSFSKENARYLKWISYLAAGDSVYFLLGNFILLLLNMSHPGVFLLAFTVIFLGEAISVAAACLSHLIQKAVDLQEESDLTI